MFQGCVAAAFSNLNPKTTLTGAGQGGLLNYQRLTHVLGYLAAPIISLITTTYTRFRLSNPGYHAVYLQPNSTLSYPISGH